MADILDHIHDLAHHAYDAITGVLSPPSDPPKPAYTGQDAAQHLGTGIVSKGVDAISGRQAQIDKAVDDAS